MKQDMKTQLLTKSPKELLFKLAIPGIIGMLVIGLYPFMDGIFAGRLIGDYAMSAISVSMSLTIINGGISALIGVGSASILSRAIGKGDKEIIDKIFGNFCYWVILFSAIITIAGLIFAPHFLDIVCERERDVGEYRAVRSRQLDLSGGKHHIHLRLQRPQGSYRSADRARRAVCSEDTGLRLVHVHEQGSRVGGLSGDSRVLPAQDRCPE